MRLAFLNKINHQEAPLIPALHRAGIDVVDPSNDCDIFWNSSVDFYKESEFTAARFPTIPVVNYCWDLYEWAWQRKRKDWYDWPGYVDYLKKSALVLVPNVGTQLRVAEYGGIDSTVVHTSVDYKDNDTPLGDYVLNPLREYPDPHWGWTERACKELDIPYLWTDHQLSKDAWEDTVAAARVIVCEYQEASTGGLTLIEGLWNGVPSIVYDGPYSGGLEYLGPHAHTFSTYESLKKQIHLLYNTKQRSKPRQFIEQNYAHHVMAATLVDLFKGVCNGKL